MFKTKRKLLAQICQLEAELQAERALHQKHLLDAIRLGELATEANRQLGKMAHAIIVAGGPALALLSELRTIRKGLPG